MFVFLSKLLDLAVSPLAWALALGLVALVLARRRHPRAARRVGGLGVVVLWALSMPLVSSRLMHAVEASAPSTYRPDVEYDAVIVLGGSVEAVATATLGQPEFNQAAERVLRSYDLLREGRARAVLLSGGAVFPSPGITPEAHITARLLRTWGIASERIVVEDRSRNTRENATESVRIVRERGWRRVLLVTSAFHMPRALGCFRAAGLEPDTLPVDLRAPGGQPGFAVLPRAGALAESEDALRELLGRVVYRLVGYSK